MTQADDDEQANLPVPPEVIAVREQAVHAEQQRQIIAAAMGVPVEYLGVDSDIASLGAWQTQHEVVQQHIASTIRQQLSGFVGQNNTEDVRRRIAAAAGDFIRERLAEASIARRLIPPQPIPTEPEVDLDGHAFLDGTRTHLPLDDYLAEGDPTGTLLVSANLPPGTLVVTSSGHEFYVDGTLERHPAHGEIETTAQLRHSPQCRKCFGSIDREATRGLTRTLHGACVDKVGDPPPYLGRLLPVRNTMDGLFDAPELDIDTIINLRSFVDKSYGNRIPPVVDELYRNEIRAAALACAAALTVFDGAWGGAVNRTRLIQARAEERAKWRTHLKSLKIETFGA